MNTLGMSADVIFISDDRVITQPTFLIVFSPSYIPALDEEMRRFQLRRSM